MMNPFQLSKLLALSGGHVFGDRQQFVEPVDVCIDSRKGTAKSLFVPLEGERTDGHLHIESALENGCSAALVLRSWAEKHLESIADWAQRYGVLFFPVDDTLKQLQKLAEEHRKCYPSLTVIGITGSNGKTTTKEMVSSILNLYKPTYKNPGNLNSEIGLPLTVLRMKGSYDYAVLEMGINHIGEMDVLKTIARPDLAVITNIGRAHIGHLGSQRKIAEEKRKIFSGFGPGNAAFLYENEGFMSVLTEHLQGPLYNFGERSEEGLLDVVDMGLDGYELEYADYTIAVPLPGKHNLQNALAAIGVARYLGVPVSCIQEGLAGMTASFGRSEILKGVVTVVQDCYNANPDSVLASVRMVSSMPTGGRRILVLGDMLELGEESPGAHASLADWLDRVEAERIFLFGPEMKAAFNAMSHRGSAVFHTTDFQELKTAVMDYIAAGDLVLLKGSRGMELERLTDGLTGYRAP